MSAESPDEESVSVPVLAEVEPEVSCALVEDSESVFSYRFTKFIRIVSSIGNKELPSCMFQKVSSHLARVTLTRAKLKLYRQAGQVH